MRKVGLLVGLSIASACGRIGFDPLAGTSDGMLGDDACSALSSMCGPAGTSPCCSSPLVPGGTFLRSFDVGADNAYTDMTNPATVSDFRLDTYEVTVGRFRAFVNDGMGTQTSPPTTGVGARTLNGMTNQGGWDATWTASLATDGTALAGALTCDPAYQTWTDMPGANEALPMNCITWFEAFAFCAWDGGFLPTEAEWNYAAAGGGEQRPYPWSNPASSLTLDCSHANYRTGTGFAYCVNPPTGAVNRVGSESPQGDGKWSQADLEGNVEEWTLDWHANSYRNPCADCAYLSPATSRVLRGGAFNDITSRLRAAERFVIPPEVRLGTLGGRCARAP